MSTERTLSGTAELSWFKSSYSGNQGGDCVEIAWSKSSYSGNEGGNCVEFASGCGAVHVRDSKDPGSGTLTFSASAWSAFVGLAAVGR